MESDVGEASAATDERGGARCATVLLMLLKDGSNQLFLHWARGVFEDVAEASRSSRPPSKVKSRLVGPRRLLDRVSLRRLSRDASQLLPDTFSRGST